MYKAEVTGGHVFDLELKRSSSKKGASSGMAHINGEEVNFDVLEEGKSFHAIVDQKSYNIHVLEVDKAEKKVRLSVNGNAYEVGIKSQLDQLLESLGMDLSATAAIKDLKSPMPGLIVELKAQPGDELKKGDPILVLEAMKMENVLKAPSDVVIEAFKVQQGDTIEKNAVLVTFK